MKDMVSFSELEKSAYNILKGSYDSIFRYNIATDKLLVYQLSAPFRWPSRLELSLDTILESQYIHPEDQDEILRCFSKTVTEKKVTRTTIRILLASKYYWHEIILYPLFDENPDLLFLLLRNCDKEKRALLQYKLKSELDSLTGLYNRGTLEELINQDLQKGNQNKKGVLLIDIDNFRQANNTYGHLFGDILLIEFSQRLKTVFYEDALIGRLGGDEFLIYFKNIEDLNILLQKVKKLTIVLQRKFSNERSDFCITTSIGISIATDNLTSFNELYDQADIALYQAKKLGSNCYHVYDSAKKHEYKFDYQNVSKNHKQYLNKDEISALFAQMILKNLDVKSAITGNLAILTKQYNFSRSYIVEIDRLSHQLQVTYTWERKDINKFKLNTDQFPYEDIYHQLKYQNGVMYLSNIDSIDSNNFSLFLEEGIKSLLHLTILEGREIRGFVGFDNFGQGATLTKEQINELKIAVQVLSLFLFQLNKVKQIYQISA